VRLFELGEDRFIERLSALVPEPGPEVKLGIGDDAAVLALSTGAHALLSTDVLVEGVHFTLQTLPPAYVGRKAVAVNVSDVAAMGGRPVAIVASMTVSASADVDYLLELFGGIVDRARELNLDLVGGNLSASPGPMVLAVSILGAGVDDRDELLTRSGARPGDLLFVSGKLGASAEGLELLQEGMVMSAAGAVRVPHSLRGGPVPLAEDCLRAHMDPEPRISLGQFLSRAKAASACIDLSDGMAKDLPRLCLASGVGARIEERFLPIHPGVLAWERVRRRPPLEQALSGGEDYELLFTVRNQEALSEYGDVEREQVPITCIGKVTEAREGIRLVLREGTERILTDGGWDHFQRGPGSSRAK
jgi:thiamine-monophosphate kinase